MIIIIILLIFSSFKLVAGKMKKEGSHIAYPELLSWNSVSQWLYHTLSLKQCTNRNLFFSETYISTKWVRKGTAWYKMDAYKVSIEALGVYMYNGSSPPSQYALSVDYMHKKRKCVVTEALPFLL